LRGVTPDIPLPALTDAESFGESSFDNALPWTQIKAADYTPAGDLKGLFPILVTLHEARVKTDKDFQYLQEDIAEFKLQRKKNLVSLNEPERRKERDAQEARLKSRESRRDTGSAANDDVFGKEPAAENGSSAQDDGLQVDERKLGNQLAAEKVRKNAKDVLLNEAVNILGDEVGVLNTGARLATRVKPGSRLTPE
jgi:carboxyl-terminal processing protease